MSVLIASLVADNDPWLNRFLQQLDQLDYDKRLVHYAFVEGKHVPFLHEWCSSKPSGWIKEVNPQIVDRFERLAHLRNFLVDNALKDENYVLWIDSDIVKIPSSLIIDLWKHGKKVVAPAIWIEETTPDQFYDTLAFRNLEGKNFPIFNLPYSGLLEVSSVGTCYLINSKLYQNSKVRYSSGGDSEHVGFCKQVRQLGEKLYVDMNIRIEHARLPKYGRNWH